jgi:hypothetical protein
MVFDDVTFDGAVRVPLRGGSTKTFAIVFSVGIMIHENARLTIAGLCRKYPTVKYAGTKTDSVHHVCSESYIGTALLHPNILSRPTIDAKASATTTMNITTR